MEHFRLLILDDDPMIGMTIQAMACSAGSAGRLTTEADDFFAALDDWQPTHLCVDLNMPGQDGLQVLAELARRQCRASVIVSSGVEARVLDAAARAGNELGLSIAGVLPKPFTIAALRGLMRPGPPAGSAPAGAAGRIDWRPGPDDLAQAIVQRQFVVAYQPKVHCASGRVTGLEALVRWAHPRHGSVGPDAFIGVAEQAGLIDELTLQVLEQALDWFAPWRRGAPRHAAVTLSLNLSARSLSNAPWMSRLPGLCRAAGVAHGSIIFELTETAAMEDPRLALELLTRLRLQGFHLSIDDFGTGYSSMLQLVRLPFSEVKVDRSFVMGCAGSSESRAVIRSIVDLGHSLGLRVTAEGVEDATALAFLREVGCDDAQGYLFARPMPAAQLEAWLAARDAQALV